MDDSEHQQRRDSESGEDLAAGGSRATPENILLNESEDSDLDLAMAPQPEVTRREVDAWMMVEWSNSPYSTVAIAGFLPVCVQTAAILHTGFPKVCPNVITDEALIRATFPLHNFTSHPVMYRIFGKDLMDCVGDPSDPACTAEYCRGLPTTVTECLQADGVEQFALGLDGEGSLNPTAFVTLCISLSVVLQALAFFTLGPLADFGSNRKRYLTASTVCGAASMMAVLLVSTERYWLGGVVILLSNAAFGMSTMLSYVLPKPADLALSAAPVRAMAFLAAYLPVLLLRLPDTLDRFFSEAEGLDRCGFGVWRRLQSVTDAQDRPAVTRQRSDELSNAAFGVGYVAGVMCLFTCTPFVVFATSMQATWDGRASILGFQLSMAAVGAWWLFFYYRPYKDLHARPGPTAGRRGGAWGRAVKHVMLDVKREPMTMTYLGLWFMFSDGAFVISSVATLFANSEVDWGCFPKTIGLLLIAVNAAVGAGVGSLVATRVQKCLGASTKTMLIGSLLVCLLVPIYGLAGYISDDIGFREGWELLLFAGIYGLAIGPMQGFSRTLYSLLLPPGRESLYFALYQVSDKGSAMLGPLVISWVTQATGSMRLSFIYSVLFILIPVAVLCRLDVEKGHEGRNERAGLTVPDAGESSTECGAGSEEVVAT